MSESEDLLRLAERAGVGTRYRDVWGEPRIVGPDTLRAVLAAIGGFVAGIFLCRTFFSGESSEFALILVPCTALLVGAAAFVFAFTKTSSYGERPDGLP